MHRQTATIPPMRLIIVNRSLTPNIRRVRAAGAGAWVSTDSTSAVRAESLRLAVTTPIGSSDATQRLRDRRHRRRRRLLMTELEMRDVLELVELATGVRRQREGVDDRAVGGESQLRGDAQDVRVVDLAGQLRILRGGAAGGVDRLELVGGDRHPHPGA